MESKLSEVELNYQNDYGNFYSEIPSYQMQTISSRLKIVEKDEERNQSRSSVCIPFTVGSTFVTHNVKLLKQETLQKLKAIFLSYRNESEINGSNMNELRLLKSDIDSFRFESQKLMYFSSRRKQFLKAITSRYKYCSGRKDQLHFRENWLQSTAGKRRREKTNVLRDENQNTKELAGLLKIHNRLETLFRKNKSNTNLSTYKGDGINKRESYEIDKPVKDVSNERANNEYALSRGSSSTTVIKHTLGHKPVKGKRNRHRASYDNERDQDYERNFDEKTDETSQQVKPALLSHTDISLHLAEIQQNLGSKHFAPSIRSRRKERRHVRRYNPSEAALEDVQEPVDDNTDLVNTQYANDFGDHDEILSNKSANRKRATWSYINKTPIEFRAQTDPNNE